MRKKGFKGRCEKRMLGKSEAVCRLYDPIQSAYADRLQEDDAIREFRCNVLLDDGEHMTDLRYMKEPLLAFPLSLQDFAPAIGVDMLDATACDIYLVDDAGNLVGSPILTARVDAYSDMC